MKKALWISLAATFGVLTVVGAVGNVVLQGFRPQLNSLLGIKNDTAVLNKDVKYFTSEFDSVEQQVEEEGKLCTELEAEGAVLLKNENNTLPFAAGSTFSAGSAALFGGIGAAAGAGIAVAVMLILFKKKKVTPAA